jgi:uncharacterized membrane protein (DUF106 family)
MFSGESMADLKKYGGYIALLLAMLLILSYSIPFIRDGVGNIINSIFGPLVDELKIPFFILIIILSTITALYSSLIQKYTIDYEKMQESQEKMKEFQKEYREAQLSQDEKRIKKLDVKRDRMMKEQLELSQQQFKPMAYILLLTVPIFFWLLFRLAKDHSSIVLPFFGSNPLGAVIILGIVPAWMFWYLICSLAFSQVIRKTLNIGGL